MTLFDTVQFSEIREPGWNINTLRPPLKLKEILLDFRIEWSSYSCSRITFSKKLKFLSLRILQRFAYNLGWIKLIMKNRNLGR